MDNDNVSANISKLSRNERQQYILDLLLNQREVQFKELSKMLDLTEMTIRRDIDDMESEGLVRKTLGGAILRPSYDVTMQERGSIMNKEKIRIGKTAEELIQQGEAIFIDSGTTALQIVRHMKPNSIRTIVTNSPAAALELQGKNISIIMTGGQLVERTNSLIGLIAEENLKKMSFDRAFIAATGLTEGNGFSNSNVFEIPIKLVAAQQAKEVNVVMDHSKFGIKSLTTFLSMQDVNRLITDKNPSQDILELCERNGVEVLIAPDS